MEEIRHSVLRFPNSSQYGDVCKHCVKCLPYKKVYRCEAGVPYYGVSLECKDYAEGAEKVTKEISLKEAQRFLDKVLVDTI